MKINSGSSSKDNQGHREQIEKMEQNNEGIKPNRKHFDWSW